MPKRGPQSDPEIAALFQLPLGEFTAERNALAKRLAKEGKVPESERVKALTKPSSPAWAVNQLYWQDPSSIESLLAVGERIRKAHSGKPDANRGALLDEKKRLLADLRAKSEAILTEAGIAASSDTMSRVSATLESLAAWGQTGDVPKAGLLTAELEPPGFEALAALMGGGKSEPAKVLAFPGPKKKVDSSEAAGKAAREAERKRIEDAARTAFQEAEAALREARRDAEQAESAAKRADDRVETVEKQKQQMEVALAKARDEAGAAASRMKSAAKAVADAERLLAEARAALER